MSHSTKMFEKKFSYTFIKKTSDNIDNNMPYKTQYTPHVAQDYNNNILYIPLKLYIPIN